MSGEPGKVAAAEAVEEVDSAPRRRHRSRELHDIRTGWAFMAPFAVLFALVFLIPIVVSIRQSFYAQKTTGGGLFGGGSVANAFVGLQNYRQVVDNEHFWLGIARVVGYALVQIPVMIVAALALALLLDSWLTKHVGAYRLAYFLPYAIPGIVAAMVWLYLYTPEISPLVKGLQAIGLHVDFMGSHMVLISMANMTTWTYTGYNMLIFLAALQAIPKDVEEAARIDGASGWQVVWRIKVPLVGGATLLAVLFSIIGTIQLFNEPTVMATVNPWMGADYTPMMMAYNTMMGTLSPSGDGPASAVSILMAIIAGALAVIYALAQRRLSR